MCLLALAASVKPLADIVANYACCDRHKETGQDCIHSHHLLSVARLEKGSGFNIPTALDSVKATAAGIAKAPRNLGAFAATWARSHALAFAFYKSILP